MNTFQRLSISPKISVSHSSIRGATTMHVCSDVSVYRCVGVGVAMGWLLRHTSAFDIFSGCWFLVQVHIIN